MKKILENDVTEWGIMWTYTIENFGSLEEKDLIADGKNK